MFLLTYLLTLGLGLGLGLRLGVARIFHARRYMSHDVCLIVTILRRQRPWQRVFAVLKRTTPVCTQCTYAYCQNYIDPYIKQLLWGYEHANYQTNNNNNLDRLIFSLNSIINLPIVGFAARIFSIWLIIICLQT